MASRPWGYNGSGRAASKASAEALRAQGLREIGTSIHAVTVPGAVDAWEATLKAHGTHRPRPRAGAGDSICRRRLSGRRARCLRLGALRHAAQGRSRHGETLSVQRHVAEGRRRHQAAGAGQDAEGDRGKRRARALRRRNRRRHGGDAGRARLADHGGGFRRAQGRSGHADLQQLSRARRARIAAERAGPHRAGDAQYSRNTSI